ncbi:unnamed protein product, partial [Discosporangium mesarthrocarpum]
RGGVSHLYRLTVNLVSVRDLDRAVYTSARYHYPYLGTTTSVRTAVVWVPPRSETPLSNSCCTHLFAMTPERLRATAKDHPLVVSLISKDQFSEEELGAVALPLEELLSTSPQFFRCPNTNKTFTTATGFQSHIRSRERAGNIPPLPVA